MGGGGGVTLLFGRERRSSSNKRGAAAAQRSRTKASPHNTPRPQKKKTNWGRAGSSPGASRTSAGAPRRRLAPAAGESSSPRLETEGQRLGDGAAGGAIGSIGVACRHCLVQTPPKQPPPPRQRSHHTVRRRRNQLRGRHRNGFGCSGSGNGAVAAADHIVLIAAVGLSTIPAARSAPVHPLCRCWMTVALVRLWEWRGTGSSPRQCCCYCR